MTELVDANSADTAGGKGRMARLLSPSFWDGTLQRFAEATGLVVTLYDRNLVRHSGPHTLSPISQQFRKAGFWADAGPGTALERDSVGKCVKAGELGCATVLGALGLCSMPALVSGEIVGAFVVGWVPNQFVDPVVSNRIAATVGLHEMDVWQVLRSQPPMTTEKMLLSMQMLQNFAEVLLKELENKEKDLEQARALRVIAISALDVSVASSPREISKSISKAVMSLIPGSDVGISLANAEGEMEAVLNHASSFTSEPQIVSEHSLKVPIKSSSQMLLGAIDVRLPADAVEIDRSSELSTLAAQAAIALQRTKLISDLASERNALDKANAELRHLHRMKDEFLATISHELRTPLNSMLGWSQILREDHLPPEEFHDAMEAIERNAKVQARLIEDLLDVSRVISGKMVLEREVVNLNDILKRSIETIRPAAENKSQALEVHIPDVLIPIRGDATRLQQVFWNILSNASKFTLEGGTITITAQKSGGYASIVFKDNGKGIPKEFVPHLFDRFSQADGSHSRKYGGLGLGLAIVRHIVELHGGSVSASSEGEGLGSAFTVTLPVNITDAELESARELIHDLDFGSGDGRRQLKGLKILAVDDEPDSLRLVKFVLEKGGATVRAVESAAQAYEVLRKWHPDLIVSDISMPEQNGYELIQQIRELAADEGGATPAFALTAHAGTEDKIRALKAGFQRHFPKPIDTRALLASVKELSDLH